MNVASPKRTEIKSFWSAWLKNEYEHGNYAEEAVRQYQMNDVVEVSAPEMKCKGRT